MSKRMRKDLVRLMALTMTVVAVSPVVYANTNDEVITGSLEVTPLVYNAHFSVDSWISEHTENAYTELEVGETLVIDIENSKYEVISGDNVVSLDADGTVKALEAGTAIIQVNIIDGSTKSLVVEKIVVKVTDENETRLAPADVFDMSMWKLQMAIENPYIPNQVLEAFPNTENLRHPSVSTCHCPLSASATQVT